MSYKKFILLANLALFLLLIYFQPFGESKVNHALALLILIAIFWISEALPITITAILVPVLASILGLMSTKSALSGFADPIIFLFFGGFALAAAMHHQKLDHFIAYKIIALAKGHFGLSSLYLFIATAFLSMWMSNTATTAMILPLALGMLSSLDPKKERNTYIFLLLGIAFSANIGGIGTLVGTPPNAIVAKELQINFVDWLKYGIPIVIIFLPLMIATLFFVFKPRFNLMLKKTDHHLKLNQKQIITLVIFGTIASLWIFSKPINHFISPILGLEKNIASFDSIIAICAVILVCISGAIDWKGVEKSTDWGVLLLFGGGITLSTVLKDSGASQFIANHLVTYVHNMNIFSIILIVTLFIIFLTEVTSNTASAALLVPLFVSIAHSLELPSLALALIIGIGASCAFMLPVATPPNAIVFGTGYMKQSDMIKVGIILNLIFSFTLALIADFFWL